MNKKASEIGMKDTIFMKSNGLDDFDEKNYSTKNNVSEDEKDTAAYLAQDLRLNGFIVETDLMNKSLKAQFKSVDRFNSKYLIVLNDNDLAEDKVTIKDNKTKEEEKVSINDLVDYLDMHM